MRRWLIDTDNDVAALLMRLALGVVMLPHGAQKLLGWYGGHGFSGTMQFLTQGAGLPYPVALAVIIFESVGSLLLIVGFLGRFWAMGIAAVMIGAVVKVHSKVGFFMNWSGQQQGEGYEYHILALGLAIALMITGSGALSIDRGLTRRR